MLSMCSRIAISALRVVLVLGFTAFGAVAAAEGDIERGRLLSDTCEGCHAVEDYNNVYPTYHVPRLGGQSKDYLVQALKLYRDGERSHGTMAAQASAFSDQDILDIATYLSGVVGPLTAAEPNGTAPDAATVCASCHGPAGIGNIATYPYLAGQHEDYLEQALSQYKSGARKGANATIMQAQLMTVSDEDLQAIAAFYAQQEGLQTLPRN